MELDLQSARIAREVEAQIKTALARLPSRAAQKDVLERVVLDVLAAGDVANAKPASIVPRVKSADDGAELRLWERIVEYCIANPVPGNKFRTADIADAILPDKSNRNAAASTIYTAVKRKCRDEVEDFAFVWLGNGRFRLATQEERDEARGK